MSKYIARKDFKFSGRMFSAGDKFNWRRLACNQRKLDTLISAGLVQEEGSVQVVEPVIEEPVIEEPVYEELVEEYEEEIEEEIEE
jgi:hypothetical protein